MPQPWVLVVDDDGPIRECVSEVLEDEGIVVGQAANGGEALRRLRASHELPALILLDLMMPIMDGFQFRIEQAQDPALAQIPVIVLSADSNVTSKAAALRVAGVIRKPVRLDDLLKAVRRYCAPKGTGAPS